MSKSFRRQIILNADQLRKEEHQVNKEKLSKNEIYIILDNVLDTYNIGSVFRLADAVSAKRVYLCGGTETPPNSRIKKSSINTTEIVDWKYTETALEAISQLRKAVKGIQIVAVEQSKSSVLYDKYHYSLPIALIVGNESYGVSQEVLNVVDSTVELPMFGVNVSLNVMVSLAIVLYQVIEVNKLAAQ